jgi:hypothetical protein
MCGRGVGGKGRVCLLAICQYCKSKGDVKMVQMKWVRLYR